MLVSIDSLARKGPLGALFEDDILLKLGQARLGSFDLRGGHVKLEAALRQLAAIAALVIRGAGVRGLRTPGWKKASKTQPE